MTSSSWIRSLFGSRRPQQIRQPRFELEQLEDRVVPYAVSGNAWPNPALVTISFMPDGTTLSASPTGTITSNLFSTFNAKFGSPSVWQDQIIKAAQTWAQVANINFRVVSDSGASAGSGAYQQGSSDFGDIRIGGYRFGNNTLATAFLPPPVNNYSIAGDIRFNTGQTFNIGSTYDLFTVSVHEFGHALGLYHSTTSTAQMYAAYNSVKNSLNTDDTNGIRAIYAARPADPYDANGANGSRSTADDITSSIDTHKKALVTGLDITTTSDLDFFKFTVPSGTSSTMKVQVQSHGLSLLKPQLTLYNSSGTQLATLKGTQNGDTISLSHAGVAAGQLYYVKVSGAESTAFGTGKYALALNFTTGATPVAPSPITALAIGSTPSGGGGIAYKDGIEYLVNTNTLQDQTTIYDVPARQSVGMDDTGNSVAVWSSASQDGSGWGVFGQRFDASGNRQGSEFRVNSFTNEDQASPAVAMDGDGDFVVTWMSKAQDPDGSWGIYAQRYRKNGHRAGSEFRVNTTTVGDQKHPSIAMDAGGNFVIAWMGDGQDGSGFGIFAQRFDASGGSLGGEFQVHTTTESDQMHPIAAMDSHGAFVITWTSNDEAGLGVFAQRFSGSGEKAGPEFRVNDTTGHDQSFSFVDMADNGTFVIAWQSMAQDRSGWGIFARRFDKHGVALGSEFQVSQYSESHQQHAALAVEKTNNFVITWTSLGNDSSMNGIYARQYAGGGGALADEFRVNTTNVGDQQYSSVVADKNHGFAIVWSGSGPGDDVGVFGQRYDTSSMPIPRSESMSDAVSHSFDPNGCDHAHGEDRCCPNCGIGQGPHPAAHSAAKGTRGEASFPYAAWLIHRAHHYPGSNQNSMGIQQSSVHGGELGRVPMAPPTVDRNGSIPPAGRSRWSVIWATAPKTEALVAALASSDRKVQIVEGVIEAFLADP